MQWRGKQFYSPAREAVFLFQLHAEAGKNAGNAKCGSWKGEQVMRRMKMEK
jgi:hypothetical protein